MNFKFDKNVAIDAALALAGFGLTQIQRTRCKKKEEQAMSEFREQVKKEVMDEMRKDNA